jgi:hypothetical protein
LSKKELPELSKRKVGIEKTRFSCSSCSCSSSSSSSYLHLSIYLAFYHKAKGLSLSLCAEKAFTVDHNLHSLLKTQNSLADGQIYNNREIKAKHPQLCKDTKERSKPKKTHSCTKDGTFGVQKSIKECVTNSIHQQQNSSQKNSIEKKSFFARKSQKLDRRDQTTNNT